MAKEQSKEYKEYLEKRKAFADRSKDFVNSKYMSPPKREPRDSTKKGFAKRMRPQEKSMFDFSRRSTKRYK